MPININADFIQLTTWLNDNLSNERFLVPHSVVIPRIPSKGIYFWFMHPDGYKALSNFVSIKPLHSRFSKEINGVNYDLVYLGTTGTGKEGNSNLTKRLNWHIHDKHTPSSVTSGALSTLRQGLGSLLSNDLIILDTELLVNEFMNKYMIIYWIEYPDNKQLIDDDENILINIIRPLLNLKNNPNAKHIAFNNPTLTYKSRRNKVVKDTKFKLGYKNVEIIKFNTQYEMQIIKEHFFDLNGEQYQLSFFEKPILLKNGLKQKVKPILKAYIEMENLPIQLVNKNGNEEVPWTLARKILEYFSKNVIETNKSNNLVCKKKDKNELKPVKTLHINSDIKNNKLGDNFNYSDNCNNIDITSTKRIVLISCVSSKGKNKAKAKDMYKGPLFTNSLAYGLSLKPDQIFILSALHHLLDLEKEIEPYDITLSYVTPNKKKKKPSLKVLTKDEAKLWGQKVLEQLSEKADLKKDEFIILAGQDYVKPIANGLTIIKEPLIGIIQGKRPAKLKDLIREINRK